MALSSWLAAATVATSTARRGTVYGVVLNDTDSLARLGAAAHDPPHLAPPRAPVLYIKPANTLTVDGATVALPAGAEAVEIGATLGVVLGRDCARVSADAALRCIAGYVVAADLSLPHAGYFRPAIREKCFDGACPVGTPVAADCVPDPSRLTVRTFVDDRPVAARSLADLVRPIPQLIADVAEFMTLRHGDLLLTGVPWQAPRARAGQQVRVVIEGVGELRFALAPPQPAQMPP